MTGRDALDRETRPLRRLLSVVNARDLGGLPLVGGGTTRREVLLRSDAPYPGDSAPPGIIWPPTTVIDLRDPAEAAVRPFEWPVGVHRAHLPLFSAAQLHHGRTGSLTDLYIALVEHASPRIAEAINQFDPAGPTLVHCAVGKDRTGVVTAIALLLAGVKRESIVADYARTEDAIENIFDRMSVHKPPPPGFDVNHPILRSPAEAIEAALDRVASCAGGPWGWASGSGVDVTRMERWCERFHGDQ